MNMHDKWQQNSQETILKNLWSILGDTKMIKLSYFYLDIN